MVLSVRHIQPLLASIGTWNLSPGEWVDVEKILRELGAALDAGDDRAAGAAVATLALKSDQGRPSRPLTADIATPSSGADPQIIALADRLVHRLVVDPSGPALSEQAE